MSIYAQAILMAVSFLAAQGADPCIFPTKYKGHTMDGCTTKGHTKAWCYTSGDSDWRTCDADDDACEFPFEYKEKSHWECTSADHDQNWCFKAGGGWKNCAPQNVPEPPSSGHFGQKSGAAGWVADHNHFRSKHGADPVAWDSDLADKAQTWAKTLSDADSMYHSNSYKIWPPSGENLAWGYGGSCSAADGAPNLYDGPYDQHCVAASWYGEYYLWRGSGQWQGVDGLGHFTAMVWKGVDLIGCATSGKYSVCEYGSKHCKNHEEYGGTKCWGSDPPHLPNFNKGQCSGGKCVGDLFALSDVGALLGAAPAAGVAPLLAAVAAVGMLAAGAALVVRRLRSRAPVVLQEEDGDDETASALISA